MDTSNLSNLALIFECRRKGIKTFVMQHGLFHDLKTNITIDKALAANRLKEAVPGEALKSVKNTTFRFFINSLRITDLFRFFHVVRWQLNRRRMLDLEATALNRLPYQQADEYIVFTKFNGRYFTETDGVGPERMREIGMPEFDPFAHYQPSSIPLEKYVLVIDSAWTFNKEMQSDGLMGQGEFNRMLSEINDAAIAKGCRLHVKLHPYSYHNDRFLQHENITYFRDTDVVKQLMDAEAVAGFDSTLMIFALYFKPTVMINMDPDAYLARVVRQESGHEVLLPAEVTKERVLGGFSKMPDLALREVLEKLFLYRVDGKSKERLKNLLVEKRQTIQG
ncbi:MAG: hypothetical protein EOO09_00955 [Chitinophagaceae bacterium]|nr:MAG: hypothetical protein EOO09_00955 [Chitinophagaceae bacterium]